MCGIEATVHALQLAGALRDSGRAPPPPVNVLALRGNMAALPRRADAARQLFSVLAAELQARGERLAAAARDVRRLALAPLACF